MGEVSLQYPKDSSNFLIKQALLWEIETLGDLGKRCNKGPRHSDSTFYYVFSKFYRCLV